MSVTSSRGRSTLSGHQQRSGRPVASPSRPGTGGRPNSAASGGNNTAFSTVKRAHSPFRLKTLSNECSERSNGGGYSSVQVSYNVTILCRILEIKKSFIKMPLLVGVLDRFLDFKVFMIF